MKATQKKAVLDGFVRSLEGTVSKYLCFGIYNSEPKLCKQCKVSKQCKGATPK